MGIQTPQYLENKGYTAALDRSMLQEVAVSQEGVTRLVNGIVTAGTGLTVSVSPVRAFIQGDTSTTQGYYHFASDTPTVVTLNNADGTNPRIDLIVARVYDSVDGGAVTNQGTIEVITGSPNSGAALTSVGVPTGAPSIPATALPLAYVLVGTGVTSLTAAKIQDARQTWGASRGNTHIDTSESTSSTSYTLLTTNDLVRNVVMPIDGMITVWYQAIWENTVTSNARAAIFIDSNQLKIQDGGQAAPIVQETPGPAATNTPAPLCTYTSGLTGQGNSFTGLTEVTTGQAIANTSSAGSGGPVYIFAAPGTYNISIRFKNQAAGTLTVSKRHLWVQGTRF